MQDIKTQAENNLLALQKEAVTAQLRDLISNANKKSKYISHEQLKLTEMQIEIEKITAMSIDEAETYFDEKYQNCNNICGVTNSNYNFRS